MVAKADIRKNRGIDIGRTGAPGVTKAGRFGINGKKDAERGTLNAERKYNAFGIRR
jgi:hypothetical protein